MGWSFIGAASGNDEIVTLSNVAFWALCRLAAWLRRGLLMAHQAFRCAAEFGRYRSIADSRKLSVRQIDGFTALVSGAAKTERALERAGSKVHMRPRRAHW